MPTKTKVKTDKIVTYHPDGSRQTLGYRVERLTERSVRSPARPVTGGVVENTHRLSSNEERSTSWRTSVHVTNPPRSLPPVVHTRHASHENHQALFVSDRVPMGWKHEQTKERYDYHWGMKEASYASNTVTHRVMFFGPSPVSRSPLGMVQSQSR